MSRVLIASDKFEGSLTAADVAAAVRAGLPRATGRARRLPVAVCGADHVPVATVG